MKRKIRSKHNDLMNYFIHDERDLSPAYLASCRKFLKELSAKLQASSVKQSPQLNVLTTKEYKKLERRFKKWKLKKQIK